MEKHLTGLSWVLFLHHKNMQFYQGCVDISVYMVYLSVYLSLSFCVWCVSYVSLMFAHSPHQPQWRVPLLFPDTEGVLSLYEWYNSLEESRGMQNFLFHIYRPQIGTFPNFSIIVWSWCSDSLMSLWDLQTRCLSLCTVRFSLHLVLVIDYLSSHCVTHSVYRSWPLSCTPWSEVSSTPAAEACTLLCKYTHTRFCGFFLFNKSSAVQEFIQQKKADMCRSVATDVPVIHHCIRKGLILSAHHNLNIFIHFSR